MTLEIFFRSTLLILLCKTKCSFSNPSLINEEKEVLGNIKKEEAQSFELLLVILYYNYKKLILYLLSHSTI